MAQELRLVSDPVAVTTGRVMEVLSEFSFPDLFPFGIFRQYNSGLGLVGALGPFVTTNLDVTITHAPQLSDDEPNDEDDLVYTNETGLKIFFDKPTPNIGSWSYNAKYLDLALRAIERRGLELKQNGTLYRFGKYSDNIWRLQKIINRSGDVILLVRNATGILERLEHPSGLRLVFNNNQQGQRTGYSVSNAGGVSREVMRYDYDTKGFLGKAFSFYGESRHYSYGADGLLASFGDGLKDIGHYTYDHKGRVIQVETNGPFQGDRLAYDEEENTTYYYPGGDEAKKERFTLGEDGDIIEEERPLGCLTRYENDNGYKLSETNSEGSQNKFRYDQSGNVIGAIDGEGRETFYVYNSNSDLEGVIDPLGHMWSFFHDEKGHLVTITSPDKQITEVVNNAQGLPIQIMRSDGLMESRQYDNYGRLLTVIDFRGERTTFTYDSFGRTLSITDPSKATTQFIYEEQEGSSFWSPSRVVRPDGVEISRKFERGKNRTSVVDGEGRKSVYTYGFFDLLESIEDPKGGVLKFFYDVQKHLRHVENQKGLFWSFERDAAGRVIRETDFDGLVFEYVYDKADRVIMSQQADGSRFSYAYDKSGLLLTEEAFNPDGSQADKTLYSYDDRGLLSRAENTSSVVEFRRDNIGRIISETLNGREVKSGYDCCGRRITREIGGRLVESTYDPLGALQSLTIDRHAPLNLTLAPLGRELKRESAAGFRLEQGYDAVGQLLKQSAGFSLSSLGTGIDGAMKAQALGLTAKNATSVERAYQWTKAFEPTTIADERWGETAYQYDVNGQITQTKFGDGTGERFSYDAALNIDGFSEGAASKPKTPITTGAGSGYKPSTDTGRFERWQSSQGGRVTEAKGAHGEKVSLKYDIKGRVTERTVERKGFRVQIWHYEWDAKDRLVACVTPDHERFTYTYDPFGRRIFKINASIAKAAARASGMQLPGDGLKGAFYEDDRLKEKYRSKDGKAVTIGTAYHWDGNNLAEEAPLLLDGTVDFEKATRWHYEPYGFRPLAKENPDGSLWYIVTDHLGTPREMFSEDGKLQWAAEYRTWGTIRRLWRNDEPDNDNFAVRTSGTGGIGSHGGSSVSGGGFKTTGVTYGNLALKTETQFNEVATLCPIRFQGQYEDQETGLYYNRFRYYDPLAGQYISSDPIGLVGGTRAHGYVHNPNQWIDPLGLAPCCVEVTEKTLKNSAGQTVTRKYVKDDLLKLAENEAGGNLDSFSQKAGKPDYWYSPDGTKKIELNLSGHFNTNEGPHLKIEVPNGNGGWMVRDKYFIENWDHFKADPAYWQ